jgi:hypothetical protein
MSFKKNLTRIPKTVDEAAEYLISDILLQHLQALSQLSEQEFEMLYEKVTPYLLDEFRLWQGNNQLMESCMDRSQDTHEDPARIILNSVKEKLRNFNGFMVIR